jgi:hypothetical protein
MRLSPPHAGLALAGWTIGEAWAIRRRRRVPA